MVLLDQIHELDAAQGMIVLVDKPKGWSSFDVIRKLQRLSSYKKWGHAGTLDPLATGLLICCSGKKTKEISMFQALEKEYEVEFYLGATTKTYDAEFPPENVCSVANINREVVETAMSSFVGTIWQKPPTYSAVRVGGKRAYDLARSGKSDNVKLDPKQVEILSFTLCAFENSRQIVIDDHEYSLAWGRALVVCGKGTYIRSLIFDLGERLGVGGYVSELRRTRIGNYQVDEAQQII